MYLLLTYTRSLQGRWFTHITIVGGGRDALRDIPIVCRYEDSVIVLVLALVLAFRDRVSVSGGGDGVIRYTHGSRWRSQCTRQL